MWKMIRISMIGLLCAAMMSVGFSPLTAAEFTNDGRKLHWETAIDMRTLAADSAPVADGTVELINGTAEAWIDRVALPECMKVLYGILEEGADNDGEADILIEDAYLNDADYTIPVTSETLTLSGGESNEDLTRLAKEVMDRYEPFLYAVFAAFDRDHPEVFWLDGQWRWAWEISSRTSTSCQVSICVGINQVSASEYPTETMIKTAIARRDEAINGIMKDFSSWQISDYEKVVHFNEVLTKRNQYNTSPNLNNIAFDCRECIGALEGRTGINGPVCEGYARAFKVLCDRANIPCVLVDGEANNGSGVPEGHMWNYVKVQGDWYAVDVTWNDPIGGDNAALSGSESEKWLLVGGHTQVDGQSFLRSHPVSNQVYANFIGFTNGPTLSDTAFEAGAILTLNVPTGGYIYDGTEKKPQVSVKYGDAPLTENIDYTVSYSENCFEAGEHTVTVRLMGSYGGQIKGSYSIAKRAIVPLVSVTDKVYDGTAAAQVSLSIPNDSLCTGDQEVFLHGSGEFTDVNASESVAIRLTLWLTGEDSDNYMAVSPDLITASITPRPVTVRADAKILGAGENEVKLTYTVDSDTPLVEGDTLKGSLTLSERDADGVYAILQGTLTDENNPNYRISFVGATVSSTVASDSSVSQTGGADLTGDVLGSLKLTLTWDQVVWLAGIAVSIVVVVIVAVSIAVIVKKRKKAREETHEE